VARRHQRSREYQDQGDTEGDFLTAWFDHGKAPSAASYEYVLAVRTTPEAMQKLVAEPPYRVIQRDQAAHIVWDDAGRRWGCVFFVPQEITSHTVATEPLPIKTVDRPCLIMAEAVRNERLEMTVSDPDLNLGKAKGQSGAAAAPPRPLCVTLQGGWRLLEATGTVCAWRLPDANENVRILSSSTTETVLEILCQHGASYDIRLAQR
jgi:chondroitin-sulfate-ABC endolyase/exolyase